MNSITKITYFSIITSVSLIFLLSSCAQDVLADKKEELSKLRSEGKEIQDKIAKLEKEISKLDTSVLTNEKPKKIAVDTLTKITFNHYIQVQGSIDAENNVFAAPQMPGVVTQIYVQEGQKVSKGQLMAQLDNGVYLNGMEELKTGLGLAVTAYEKQKRLWEQNIGSEIQYLTAKNQKEQLERKMQTLNSQIEMTKIKAPVTGTVDEIKLKLGEMASPGYFGIRVVNLDKLSLKGRLGDTYAGKVKVGDVVKVEFPDINQTVESKVSFVSKQIDKQSRTILIEVKLDNKSNLFSGNMVANLLINDKSIPNSVVVPSNVIQKGVEGSYVMVAEKGANGWIARKRPVTFGLEYAGNTEILSGLMEGDVIVSFGYSELVDGQKIVL